MQINKLYIGIDLTKSDWLTFLGTYLSFAGAMTVSVVASVQAWFYNKKENERRNQERYKEVEPIFAIRIVSINKQLPGTGEFVNMNDPMPKHDNFRLSIENSSKYPVLHRKAII